MIVKNNSGSRFTEINTALLSLICSLLYENSLDGCIRYNDLRKINSHMNSYYDEICAHIGSQATLYLEHNLLTSDGRRSSIDESEAVNSRKVKPEHLDYLVEKRLIRKIKTDTTSARYEYIHDLFAKMVHKRRREDRKRWYQPEFRSISQSLDGISFFKKMIVTTFALLALSFLALWFHANEKHNTDDVFGILFNIKECVNNVSYWGLFAMVVYWIPLCVKRLHYGGRSGWYLTFIPIFLFSLFFRHYIPVFAWSGLAEKIIAGVCLCTLLIFCVLFFTNKSGKKAAHLGYSKEYESAWNGASIDNAGFIKMLALELACWVICCIITDSLYFAVSGLSFWKPFALRGDLLLLDKLGWNIPLPMALSQLPFILIFSNALKARTKALGYGKYNAWIPYWNILILIIGLLPNRLLRMLNLVRTPKPKNKQEDDIFTEVYNEMIATPVEQNIKSFKRKISWRDYIPFFGIARALNRNNPMEERICSAKYGCIANSIIFILVGAFILLFIKDSDIIGEIVAIILVFTEIIAAIHIVCIQALLKMATDTVKKHPEYTPAQINDEPRNKQIQNSQNS